MPIKIPIDLPAFKVLSDENIFVMNSERAINQDIRPLKIAILNLMPKKFRQKISCLDICLIHLFKLKLSFCKQKRINLNIHLLSI